ncbi:MAG: DUF4352 domain-containing protein [Candidatus Binatia bacterium]|nr:DUF4352 domain-containing protein [Candidatus Binatia bacterium]
MFVVSVALRKSKLVLLGLLLASCAGRYVRIEEKGMTCGEAQQLAISAVQRLGYQIAEVTRAEPGSPGVVVGRKEDPGRTARVLVQVFCTTMGAEIEAKAEGQGLASLDFAGQFEKTFAAMAAARPTPRPLAGSGVDVAVVVERPSASGLEVNLAEQGVAPVHVRVANHTSRPYRFEVAAVTLQTGDGRRVQPVAAREVLAKLPPEDRARVEPRVLHDRTIAPGETVDGYVFAPFQSYVRARVTLEDVENRESEGFTIEF